MMKQFEILKVAKIRPHSWSFSVIFSKQRNNDKTDSLFELGAAVLQNVGDKLIGVVFASVDIMQCLCTGLTQSFNTT